MTPAILEAMRHADEAKDKWHRLCCSDEHVPHEEIQATHGLHFLRLWQLSDAIKAEMAKETR